MRAVPAAAHWENVVLHSAALPDFSRRVEISFTTESSKSLALLIDSEQRTLFAACSGNAKLVVF